MYTQLAPLSRDLSGLILPHDHYGSHLDKNGKTCDTELEKVNFQKAGEVLAEVWNSTVIDEFVVVASYVGSDRGKLEISPPSDEWSSRHIQQSQYCLQIVKCSDAACCGHRRSSYNDVFPGRFLPTPVPFYNNDKGITYAPCSWQQQWHVWLAFSAFGIATSRASTRVCQDAFRFVLSICDC